ncbi:DUF6502 family protein [uncultured Tateyamaria sp.]|uniref:DUF6502 family protein n=1 Tax=uncultured Tateyamaria sp. TaxID=455651 RepID=UPI002630A9DB|nr:DUF6502 family protein [uncultured Tateyamaria sp.]
MASNDQTSASDAFLRVLRGLLRPLVRTMIARGLTAPVIYALLKRVYVEVAQESFGLDGTPPTDSRIALLTGVHRKDIRTIRTETDDGTTEARRKSALLATVIGQWMSHPDFTDAKGAALPLSRAADAATSFETLVQSVSKDVRPRTVLDELERGGFVSAQDDLLHLNADTIVGTASSAEKEAFFGANVGDHLAAATENLLSEQPPFFERSVFYNQMTPEAVDQIEAEARTQSQVLLEDLNRQSSAAHRRDKDADGPRQRYRLGIYFYREDADTSAEEQGPEKT